MDASDTTTTTTTTTTSSSWRASSPPGRASSSSSPPPPPHSSSPAPAPGSTVVVVSPCAACKILRRRCVEKCVLAPYFPPSEPLKFTTAHRVFGASNIIKFLQELPEGQRADAVSSMVYEANARIRDPVYGCAGAICQLQKQVSSLQAQLAKAQAEVLSMRTQQDGLIALLCSLASSPSSSPSSSPPAAAAAAAHYSDDDAAAANYINYGTAAGLLQAPCINNPLAASSAAAGIFHLDDSTSPFISTASASWEQLWT